MNAKLMADAIIAKVFGNYWPSLFQKKFSLLRGELIELLTQLNMYRDCSLSLGSAKERYFRNVDTLYEAIKHGDEKHQLWLKQAIRKHFYGK